MPPMTDQEPHNLFNEDLLQSNSFIDLLQNSSEVNMSSYMLDEESSTLPRMLSSELSPVNESVNVLDMIEQDVMFGSNLHDVRSIDSTEVTFATQSIASVAPFTSAGDVFLPSIPITTATNTFVKPFYSHISSPPRRVTTPALELSPRPVPRPSNTKPATTQSAYPLLINQLNASQKRFDRSPFSLPTRTEPEKDSKTSKTTSSSSKKSKSKSRSSSSYKRSSRSKSSKKSSRSSKSKGHDKFGSSSSHKGHAYVSTRSDAYHTRSSTRTYTATRTTSTITQSTLSLSTDTVADTARTVAQSVASCTATDTNPTTTLSAFDALMRSEYTTSVLTSYTVTRARAPTSIISPVHNTYRRTNVMHPTPVISRTPSAASSSTNRVCDQYSLLTAQKPYDIPASSADMSLRPRTRLVIPVSLGANTTTAASVERTTPTLGVRHHTIHAFRPAHTSHTLPYTPAPSATVTNTTSTVMGRTLTHSNFGIQPGSTFYTTRNLPKPAVTTEPHTFAIVDDKGTYTTLALSSHFGTTTTSTTCCSLQMTQTQHTTAVATRLSNTSPVALDAAIRQRSQMMFPIGNNQMSTSSGLGYIMTSPISSSAAAPVTISAATTATTVGSHTITTINTEALNRMRNRLVYNVPGTSAGAGSLPPSTLPADGSRPRGPVTIIANQLISTGNGCEVERCSRMAPTAAPCPRAMYSATSPQGLYSYTGPVTTTISSVRPAELATRSNRLMIPINVQGTSATSHSSIRNQGPYIITGVGQSSTTAGETATRTSRMVIPIRHSTNPTTMASTSASVATPATRTCLGACPSSDMYSKLRSRLTIPVSTTENSGPGTTSYTISRSHASQSAYSLPVGSTPYISSTKTPEGTRNPSAMTLITLTPPTPTGAPQRSPSATRAETITTTLTSPIPTIASTGNRFVIKLATTQSAASGASTSSVTTSIPTPITSSCPGQTRHRFVHPHSLPSGLRTFSGPRTYSFSQRCSMQSCPANFGPRVRQIVPPNPSPSPNPNPNPTPSLQIFADVVCPPTVTTVQTTAVATPTASRPRFTLSHSPGCSTLVMPQYKNTVFKNLSTVAHSTPERMPSRPMGPRPSTERYVVNRSMGWVSPRPSAPGVVAHSQLDSRSALQPDPTPPVSHVPVSRAPVAVSESGPLYADISDYLVGEPFDLFSD